MAIQLNTNSYVALVEADAYFASRVDVSNWDAADETKKTKALVTAATMLDDMTWAGVALGDDQPLAFPRVVEFFDPKQGAMLYSDGSVIPERIKRAQMELALHLLDNEGVLVSSGSVGNLSVGPISLVNMQSVPRIPEAINRILRPLLVNSSNSWWRAN